MISVSACFLTDKSYLNRMGIAGVLARDWPAALPLSGSLLTGAFAVTALSAGGGKAPLIWRAFKFQSLGRINKNQLRTLNKKIADFQTPAVSHPT